jgi:bacillithiol biosynthesis cysteine-adding enzyme BshC
VENARKLSEGAVAIVTGQQPEILGGPLFTLYKALTCIELAGHVSRSTGVAAVPVFWIEAEDHDREEIGTSRLISGSGQVSEMRFPNGAWAERVPASLVNASTFVESSVDFIREALEGYRFAHEVVEMIAESYSEQNVPGGFARLMAKLLPQNRGMLFLDPSQPDVKTLCGEFYGNAVSRSLDIYRSVTARTAKIRELGYKPQIKTRRDECWLFLFEDGRRSRISREGEHFRSSLSGEVFSPSELTKLATEEPHRFSSGVATRPLLQDVLLPTAAYVGGPSEIAYLAQLGGVYELMELSMPLVYPRASYTILDKTTFEISKALLAEGMPVPDSKEIAVANIIGNRNADSPERTILELGASLSDTLRGLEKRLAGIDPTLVESVRTAAEKIDYHLSKLSRKAARARIAKKDEAAMDALQAIEEILPGGGPQERFAGVISFYAKYGKALVDFLSEDIEIDGRFRQKIVSIPSEQRRGRSDES